MGAFFKILFIPLQPFIWHPELALFVSAGFAGMTLVCILHSGKFQAVTHLCMLLPMVGWLLFGLNEYRAQAEKWNIRIDLLFGWPVLLTLSIASIWLAFRELTAQGADEPTAN